MIVKENGKVYDVCGAYKAEITKVAKEGDRYVAYRFLYFDQKGKPVNDCKLQIDEKTYNELKELV